MANSCLNMSPKNIVYCFRKAIFVALPSENNQESHKQQKENALQNIIKLFKYVPIDKNFHLTM